MAPSSSAPPALPPSVEEAYRRKCIQLKQRTQEVEEANNAARVRLGRLKRQVEKMRLERAFLLEQLSKRTSTNVEDSDGSPSPPPTPKEKPLRIKRGHRKPSMLANIDSNTPSLSATFINQNLRTQSPSSDTFSTQHHHDGSKLNGHHHHHHHHKAPRKPANAFELYCDETRAALKDKNNDKDEDGDPTNLDEELARGWKDLDESQREEFQAREEHELNKYQEEKEAYDQKKKESEEEAAAADEARGSQSGDDVGDKRSGADKDGRGATEELRDHDDDMRRRRRRQDEEADDDDDQSPPPHDQEDVEMGNYDTDQETQGEKPEE